MANRNEEIILKAFDALEKELEKEPISTDRVTALTGVIKTLSDINPMIPFRGQKSPDKTA